MKSIGSVKEDLAVEKRISISLETAKKFINLGPNVKIKYIKDRPGHDLRYALNSDKIISKKDIVDTMKKNFSFMLLHFFEYVIPWLVRWKRFFNNDTELFIIWSIILLNKSVKISLLYAIATFSLVWSMGIP